jgi:hypothetical protein
MADGVSKEFLDTLDSSFMYTQILKEIFLTIDFEQSHINKFLTYCRKQFVGNNTELRNVENLRKEYRDHRPICGTRMIVSFISCSIEHYV